MVVQQRHQRYKDSIRLSSRKPIPSIVAPSTAIENIRKFSKRTVLKNDTYEASFEAEEFQRTINDNSNHTNSQDEAQSIEDGMHTIHVPPQSAFHKGKKKDFERKFFDFRNRFSTKLKRNFLFITVVILTIRQFRSIPLGSYSSEGLSGIDDDDTKDLRKEKSKNEARSYFWPFSGFKKKVEKKKGRLETQKKDEDLSDEIMMQYAPRKKDINSLDLEGLKKKSSFDEIPSLTTQDIIESPVVLENLGDLSKAYDSNTESPFFWDIKLTGAKITTDIFGVCYQLTRACENGLQQPIYNEFSLETFEQDRVRFVNVDTASVPGLERAKKLKLSKSRLADVIESRALPGIATTNLFSPYYKGRMFLIFRNPIDRAVDMYYYLATASWDPNYNPQLSKMDLTKYANSKYIENNYVTRSLVGKFSGELTETDMIKAKEIVTQKCLVGLYDKLDGSIQRFARYFGWGSYNKKKEKEIKKCRRAFIDGGDKFLNFPPVQMGSVEYDLILDQNRFDMELYEYVKLLYQIQGEKIFGIV